jgi:predicted dehydrogenase
VALAALCDLEQERAGALAAELGVPHVAATLEELLATDVDAVHLVTPAPLHAEQAIAALRALIPKRRQSPSRLRATNRVAKGRKRCED